MTDKENKRVVLQAALDTCKSSKERNALGQFATPTKLAIEILQKSREFVGISEPIRFLDPALGTGAFFSALLATFPEHQIRSAVGYEIDSHYGLPAKEFWCNSKLEVQHADFTLAEPPQRDKPNLVICNPPYVRHHHLSGPEKRRLADAAASSASLAIGGLAGLYCYFLAIANRWMPPDGIAGWLIPSEFMDVRYGAALRRYLTENVSLLAIHRFDPSEMQFDDALVSSVVLWLRNRKPERKNRVQMSYGGSLSKPRLHRSVSIEELVGAPKWSSLVFGARDRPKPTYRLGDFFHVKRGLATGGNNFFVLPEAKVREIGVPDEFLQPVLPSPRYLTSDVVEGDKNGIPVVEQRRYLIKCSIPEDQIASKCSALAKYLEDGRSTIGESYICRNRRPWFSQENRPPAPIVCTYMGRNLSSGKRPIRFILNQSRATALNVYLMLYPKPAVIEAAGKDSDLLAAIWKKLNELDSSVLLGEGRVYGGELYKLEPRELANVPADDIFALISHTENVSPSQSEMFARDVA